jgi:2-methylcitrate dehydratase PrpD
MTAKRQRGIANVLSKFIHEITYDELPENIRELSKSRILESLSSAYWCRDLPTTRTAVRIAKAYPGNSTIWGYDVKAALPYAVMANCVSSHSILMDDGSGVGGHPSTMVVPTALGVGEQERVSGKEMLVAIIVGYELMARISKSVYPLVMTAFRGGPTWGTFGCAAAAGRLMKLSIDKLSHALGYAASLTPPVPLECWWGATMEAQFEPGWSARTGIESVILAKGGATAAPYILEGKHGFLRCWAGNTDGADFLTRDLGKSFAIESIYIKPYPSCGANQYPIRVALLLAKHRLKPKEIAKVVQKSRPGGASYGGSDYAGPFTKVFQARMSRQWSVAAAILGRPLEDPLFAEENYNDLEIYELAKKIELVCEWGRTKPRTEVYCHDGRVFIAEEEVPYTEPHVPTNITEKMEKKIKKLASDRVGEKKVRHIIDIVKNIDQVDDVSNLTREL